MGELAHDRCRASDHDGRFALNLRGDAARQRPHRIRIGPSRDGLYAGVGLNVDSPAMSVAAPTRCSTNSTRMIGLGSVKEEVNEAAGRHRSRAQRREQGLPVARVSRHMVCHRPPGVGKTRSARALGEIYRSPQSAAQSMWWRCSAPIWSQLYRQTAMKTLDKCKEASTDPLVDEAYSLAGEGRISATRHRDVDEVHGDNRDPSW